jgi:mRNA interferase MazF
MLSFQRGDVVLCDLNPLGGSEQAGIRPAIIVQMDYANSTSSHTIIAPFTSKIKHALFSSHVFVPAGEGGLQQDSVILCEQIKVLDRNRVIKRIGRLDERYIAKLDQALKYILALK